MSEPLILYGIPASQPTRSVLWVCLARQLPVEFRIASPVDSSRLEELNPRKQVPTIIDDGFVLYEMAAILAYLCEKHGWSDLYPNDRFVRARLNQYLHFHHHTTRLSTFKLMGPHVTIAMGGPPEGSADVIMKETIRSVIDSGNKLETGRPIVARVAELIERGFFQVEALEGPFLCSADQPTIADFACYEELAQLEWAGLFDFGPYSKLSAWLERMSRLPAHDVVHRYNHSLGDIAMEPITMERFGAANLAGLDAMRDAGVRVQVE